MVERLEEYDFVHRIWRGRSSGEGLVCRASLCTTEVLHVQLTLYVDRGHDSDEFSACSGPWV